MLSGFPRARRRILSHQERHPIARCLQPRLCRVSQAVASTREIRMTPDVGCRLPATVTAGVTGSVTSGREDFVLDGVEGIRATRAMSPSVSGGITAEMDSSRRSSFLGGEEQDDTIEEQDDTIAGQNDTTRRRECRCGKPAQLSQKKKSDQRDDAVLSGVLKWGARRRHAARSLWAQDLHKMVDVERSGKERRRTR